MTDNSQNSGDTLIVRSGVVGGAAVAASSSNDSRVHPQSGAPQEGLLPRMEAVNYPAFLCAGVRVEPGRRPL